MLHHRCHQLESDKSKSPSMTEDRPLADRGYHSVLGIQLAGLWPHSTRGQLLSSHQQQGCVSTCVVTSRYIRAACDEAVTLIVNEIGADSFVNTRDIHCSAAAPPCEYTRTDVNAPNVVRGELSLVHVSAITVSGALNRDNATHTCRCQSKLAIPLLLYDAGGCWL
jgi:hypothetical protein